MIHATVESPYRWLFALGFLHAVIGTLIWIFFAWNGIAYPGPWHSYVMMNGFVFAMAAGFLMTAIPQFLSATPCRVWELAVAILLCSSPLVFYFFPENLDWPGWLSLASGMWLVFYISLRALGARRRVPESFPFVVLGILSLIAGGLFVLADYRVFGRFLIFESAWIALIMGIGSRLLPALLGWAPSMTEQLLRQEPKAGNRGVFLVLLLLHLLGLYLFYEGLLGASDLTLTLVLTIVAFRDWKIHRWPAHRTALSVLLWMSIWLLILGRFSMGWYPEYRVHLAHVGFIGGFALMTLGVASRVIWSHGAYPDSEKSDSRVLIVLATCFVLAVATRVSAIFLGPDSYVRHLAYAAIIFILGLVVWAGRFGPKLVREYKN